MSFNGTMKSIFALCKNENEQRGNMNAMGQGHILYEEIRPHGHAPGKYDVYIGICYGCGETLCGYTVGNSSRLHGRITCQNTTITPPKAGSSMFCMGGLHDRTEPGLVERHWLTNSDVETPSFNATVAWALKRLLRHRRRAASRSTSDAGTISAVRISPTLLSDGKLRLSA